MNLSRFDRTAMRLAILALVLLAPATPARAQDPNVCDEPGEAPDVIVGSLYDTNRYGSVGGITAFSVATTSCNIGTCWLNWFDSTNQHPVIGQNMFRLKDGRFEQIGQSWLKHGFQALSQDLCFNDCISTNGTHLGVHCSDPYSANLNGRQDNLGPRFEVNASTGVFPYPATDLSQEGNAIYKRLQVHNSDLDPVLNGGALYFVEGQYVTSDDAGAGNNANNNAYRRVNVTGETAFNISLTGSTQPEMAAIRAWGANQSGVLESVVDVPGDGRFIVASAATQLGQSLWHYEYAVHNLTSHRSGGSFEVPVPPATVLSNLGFHDVDYHSGEPFDGTDWSASQQSGADAASVVWTTEPFAQNADANALRWGTLYNFRFETQAPPVVGEATLGLFRPGSPGQAAVAVYVPRFCDGGGECDPGENACNCAIDCGGPTASELVCGDGLDDDCDGQADCADTDCCTDSACAGFDGDGDGLVSCDCDDTNGEVWAAPGETRNLLLAHDGALGTTLEWVAPLDPGGSNWSYEIVRSKNAHDFEDGAFCLGPEDPGDSSAIDAEDPLEGVVFHYLVRAVNACPSGLGSIGVDSDGRERAARLSCE